VSDAKVAAIVIIGNNVCSFVKNILEIYDCFKEKMSFSQICKTHVVFAKFFFYVQEVAIFF